MLYRGESENGTPVILKTLKTQLPGPAEIARFKHEYDMIKNIDVEGVIRTCDILYDQDRISLVLEDFQGTSMHRMFESGFRFDLETFLKSAISLADTLGAIHDHHIIHQGIRPHNILMNPDTGMLKLTGFGISTILTHENDDVNQPEVISGALVYMSPEQTGRMNRRVDYRTDLYSLGVTFYEMLTGEVPFAFQSPMEVIHAHMAIRPERPDKKNPDIPEPVGDIVMKLLSKNAEDRYQSGFGLKADLDACLNQLMTKGRIDGFELAAHDMSSEFIIPEKLYGREKEIETLLSVLGEEGDGRFSRIIWVKGAPGVGKTALINEIHKPLVARKGYFITGKYEQLRRDRPYTAIVQAFQGLIRQILTQGDEQIVIWKRDICEAVGNNGKLLTDLIPELELIIGPQPEIRELAYEQAKNRFTFLFLKFITVFLKKSDPIILFLDDLQWADASSIDLIEKMMTHEEIGHVSLIGSYRDSEVTAVHRLAGMLTRLERGKTVIRSIKLDELSAATVTHMLADFLKIPEKDEAVGKLGELIHWKTNGNPFFVKQFLQALYDIKMLILTDEKKWAWDIRDIEKLTFTDNVVALIVEKIDQLPQKTREMLNVASCIGSRFDLEMVAHLMDVSMDEA